MPATNLNFGRKTAKRVAWEAWEFTIIGPHLVEVTNASYGYLKDDHTYTVGVEDRDGAGVPAECDCPADIHHDADCKHKVALATIGGPTVLNAAINFENPAPPSDSNRDTIGDKLRADGGCDCDISEFPCWPCYRNGRRELP
jgi:hypothetical protein